VNTVKEPQTYDSPEWSKDSKKLLLSMRNPGKGDKPWTTIGFIVVDVATGTAKNVPIRDDSIKSGRFYWADEDTVATSFTSGTSTGFRFYDLNGTQEREIPDVGEPYNTSTGLFSPSGESFVTKCPGEEGGECVWDTASGQRGTRFTSGCTKVLGWYDESHLFCWTPAEGGRNQVAVIDMRGKVLRTLLVTTQSDDLGPYYSRVSPS
jgi:hypothetical protein